MEKCRACLSTDSLFNWTTIIAEKVTYKDIFFRTTSLPKKDFIELKSLCRSCGNDIKKIYNFIKKATESELLLKKENCSRSLRKEKNPISNENEISSPKRNNDNDESSILYIERDDNNEIVTDEIECTKHTDIKFEIVNVNSEVNSNRGSLDFLPEESPTKTKNIKKKKSQSKICEYCKKDFKTISAKKRHVLTMHEDNERLLCDVCPRTFRDIWGLAKHKKTHDENRKREFPCGVCEMKFLTSAALRDHEETHNGNREKQFACDQCDKSFFQKGALNVHKRIHTGQLVQCEICDKRYPRQIDLNIHLRSHTNEKPFKCATCEISFKHRCTLYNHIRKAHYGFIYKCSFCSKQFKDKEALVEHKVQHTSFRFKCALCDKGSAKKYGLKCHIRKIHDVVDAAEVEHLIISSKSENNYRKMRQFSNIEYDHLMIEEGRSDRQPIEQEYIEELKIEHQMMDEKENTMEEHLSDC